MEKVERQMGDSLSMSVPSKPEYVGVVRLTVSAIASRMGFDIEQIEDLKVAVAEACTNAITHGLSEDGCENVEIQFIMNHHRMIIHITDRGHGFCSNEVQEPNLKNPKEGGLGIFIIRALMDEVELISDIGKGTTIKMTKYLGDDIE
jgi:serine/threonine-protein kinase RsbW